MNGGARTLDEQLDEYARQPFLAMPIAGAIAWCVIGVAGAFLPVRQASWVLFVGTGTIFYLGLFVARLRGEDLLGRTRRQNTFHRLFLLTVLMAWLGFAIAIPFFLIERTSLPLSVGILSGLMWVPMSWMMRHWIGLFHGITRTVFVTIAWFAFPAHRFVAIPAVIVAIYIVSIVVLTARWRAVSAGLVSPAKGVATAYAFDEIARRD